MQLRKPNEEGGTVFNNPISVIGWIIALIGWFILLLVPGEGRTGFVNLHRLQIADAAILSGLAMVIIGTIADGFERLLTATERQRERFTPQGHGSESGRQPHNTDRTQREPGAPPPDFNLLVTTHKLRFGQFGRAEVHELRDGRFALRLSGHWHYFATLDEVQAFLER